LRCPAKVSEVDFKESAVQTLDRGQRILEKNRTSMRMNEVVGSGAGSNCPIAHRRDERVGH
jgi:hypothetical protein